MTTEQVADDEESSERLFRAWLEDLRTVRAHIDMRTRGHAVIIQLMVALSAVAGAVFAAAGEPLERFPQFLLLVPILATAGASVYLDLSWSVYVAESYVHRMSRRGLAAFASDSRQADLGPWTFEVVSKESRHAPELVVVGALKFLAVFVLPTVVALMIFWLVRPPSDWRWYDFLGFAADGVLFVVVIPVAWRVHSRRMLSLSLT